MITAKKLWRMTCHKCGDLIEFPDRAEARKWEASHSKKCTDAYAAEFGRAMDRQRSHP